MSHKLYFDNRLLQQYLNILHHNWKKKVPKSVITLTC